ncbi:hypothetical protein LXL04_008280 [Taraxacum kok-saghyz]
MAPSSFQIPYMDQAIVDQKAIFEIGDEIEVTNRAGDYSLCFYAGVITKIETGRAQIKYYDLKKEDGKVLLEFTECRYVSDLGKKICACILYTTNEEETSYFGKEDVRASVNWNTLKLFNTFYLRNEYTSVSSSSVYVWYCGYPLISTVSLKKPRSPIKPTKDSQVQPHKFNELAATKLKLRNKADRKKPVAIFPLILFRSVGHASAHIESNDTLSPMISQSPPEEFYALLSIRIQLLQPTHLQRKLILGISLHRFSFVLNATPFSLHEDFKSHLLPIKFLISATLHNTPIHLRHFFRLILYARLVFGLSIRPRIPTIRSSYFGLLRKELDKGKSSNLLLLPPSFAFIFRTFEKKFKPSTCNVFDHENRSLFMLYLFLIRDVHFLIKVRPVCDAGFISSYA